MIARFVQRCARSQNGRLSSPLSLELDTGTMFSLTIHAKRYECQSHLGFILLRLQLILATTKRRTKRGVPLLFHKGLHSQERLQRWTITAYLMCLIGPFVAQTHHSRPCCCDLKCHIKCRHVHPFDWIPSSVQQKIPCVGNTYRCYLHSRCTPCSHE